MAFCGYLKQSTTVTIQLGPFVDEDDGKTGEEGLTIEDTDVYLSKNGGAQANPNDTNNCSHDDNAYYTKQLDTTDTGTLGLLTVVVHESGALPVRQDYIVVTAHWFDTMCGSDYLQVDIEQVDGDSTAAANLNSACDNYSATRGLSGTALPAAAADAAGGLPISDAGGLDLDTQIGTDIDAILADTNEIQGDLADAGRLDALIDAIKAKTDNLPADPADDSDIDTQLSAIDTVVDSIKAVTDLLPDSGALSSLATAAALALVDTVVDSIKAKTDNLPADPADDSDIDSQLSTIDTVVDAIKAVTDNLPDSGALSSLATAAALTTVDTVVDTIVADTNELQTDWHDGGRLDLLLDAASAPTAAQVADAVWDEALGDHDTEDTVGNVLNDLTEESDGTYRFTSGALAQAPAGAAGAGAIDTVITVTSGGNPLEGVTVWVTTSNDPDDNVVASGTTDSSGQCTFYLDAGDYYVWKQKDGYVFTNPEEKSVS